MIEKCDAIIVRPFQSSLILTEMLDQTGNQMVRFGSLNAMGEEKVTKRPLENKPQWFVSHLVAKIWR